ncbi:hypothetical protein ACWC24_29325 [Streptomyces sp. NPDC001443]
MQRADECDFGVTWLMTTFHEDWHHHGPTAADAVRYQLWEELDQASVLALRQDARRLHGLGSETIEVLWQAGTGAGADFFSGSRTGVTSGTQWMEELVALCDAWLSTRQRACAVTEHADALDGVDVADEVLAEIGRTRFVTDDVRRALAECARRCTPDLAFRLLLRAMTEVGVRSGATLTAEQYARLEGIGSALHYGEYVVDAVKFLVEQD